MRTIEFQNSFRQVKEGSDMRKEGKVCVCVCETGERQKHTDKEPDLQTEQR